MGVFRIQPAMPVTAYKTYGFKRPLATHWQVVSCEDYECDAYLKGWVSVVDESTELGRKQAHFIRHDKSRKHSEEHGDDGFTRFWFPAGQACFTRTPHKLPSKMPIFYVRDGDWRGNPGTSRVHKTPENWVEDMAENNDRLKTLISRG